MAQEDDLTLRCQDAIAPILAQYFSTAPASRDDMALTKLILAALGDLGALTESAYENIEQARGCIVSTMVSTQTLTPQAAVVVALRRKGFLGTSEATDA